MEVVYDFLWSLIFITSAGIINIIIKIKSILDK